MLFSATHRARPAILSRATAPAGPIRPAWLRKCFTAHSIMPSYAATDRNPTGCIYGKSSPATAATHIAARSHVSWGCRRWQISLLRLPVARKTMFRASANVMLMGQKPLVQDCRGTEARAAYMATLPISALRVPAPILTLWEIKWKVWVLNVIKDAAFAAFFI